MTCRLLRYCLLTGKNKTKADINNRSSLTKPRGEEGQQGDIVNQVSDTGSGW